ncbi:lipoyl(octanoyl) transferase LipB [Actinomadura sp. WAC 06369]|uniref:lipoyl(octanoyl) transferase LipB n=1 Tax=Actinomadura sp. WAC 06369 TaxID=2203193 RepID=UPI001F1B44F6|nr:lipoyl(octanoyl) transferase LipB [Actinomadura sp. WAC 06369]
MHGQLVSGLAARRRDDHPLRVIESEAVEYTEAIATMDQMVRDRQEDRIDDTLWLLSHPRVYTVGRRTPPHERPDPAHGIPVVETRRGGKLTYHSPEQVVGYPVLKLAEPADVVGLIRDIEHILVAVLGELGIPAERRDTPKGSPLLTGVWTAEGRKIVSLGMYISRGVSAHGFAMDVDADPEPWTWAVPCGMPDVEMTSVCRERERRGLSPVTQPEVRRLITEAWRRET